MQILEQRKAFLDFLGFSKVQWAFKNLFGLGSNFLGLRMDLGKFMKHTKFLEKWF